MKVIIEIYLLSCIGIGSDVMLCMLLPSPKSYYKKDCGLSVFSNFLGILSHFLFCDSSIIFVSGCYKEIIGQ